MTLLLALACKGGDEGSGFALELFEDAHVASGVELASAVGFGSLRVPVRLVNAHGASVGGDSVTVEIAGTDLTTTTKTIDPDALGLALVAVGQGDPQRVTLTVTGSSYGNTEPVDSYLLGPGRALDLLPSFALSAEPSAIVAAPGGVGLVIGSEVWWQPSVPGAPPQRVLSASSALTGAWGSDLDQDGSADLVAWNHEALYLLRGHGSGGFAWGAGFAPTTGTIEQVGVGDVDDNGARDLVTLYEAGGMHGVATLLNDGLWRFTARANLELSEPLGSVAVGTFSQDAAPSLAVLESDEGSIQRYAWTEGRWLSSGQALDTSLGQGSFLPAADLNGDLVDELVLVAPDDGTGGQRELHLIDMNDGPRTYPLSYASFHVDLADLTGDLVEDLVLVDRGTDGPRIGVITSTEQGFVHRTLELLRDTGPVAAGRLEDGDLLADVAVALEALHLYPGDEDAEGWTLASPRHTSWATDALAPVHLGVWDEELVEAITVRDQDEGVSLTRLAFAWDEENGELALTHRDSLLVDGLDPDASATGLDLAICDDRAWLLVDDGGRSALYGAELAGDGYLEAVGEGLELDGESLLACGDFDEGPVAVSDLDGAASFYDPESSTDALGSEALGGLSDLVGWNPDGKRAELVACPDEGCSLAAVDLDGDGEQELVGGGAALTVEAFGQVWVAEVAGVAGALDVDGDGQLDASVTDLEHGDLAVWVTLDDELGPVLRYRWDRELGGPITLVDIDADGTPGLAAEGVNGSVVHTPVD